MSSIWENAIIRRIEASRSESVYTYGDDGPQIKFSVLVPTFNSDPILFRECIDSVLRQVYPQWELIVADDKSDSFEHQRMLAWVEEKAESIPQTVKVIHGEENLGLGGNLNRAFAEAAGDFVCVLDHDDLLLRNVLADAAEAILRQKENDDIEILYTEELAMTVKKNGPYGYDVVEMPTTIVKWPFDELTFMQAQYVNHLTVLKRSLVETVGGWSEDFDGSQDYDLLLRCIFELNRKAQQEQESGKQPKGHIKFIEQVGYVWRRHGEAYSNDVSRVTLCNLRAQRAIQEYADVRGWDVDVLPGHVYGNYHLRPRLSREAALAPMAVVIPCGGDAELLMTCLRDLLHATQVSHLSVVVVAGPATACSKHMNKIYDELPQTFGRFGDIRVVRHQMTRESFNFSHACNIGVVNTSAENVLFLNTDLSLMRGWAQEAVGWLHRPEVGVVGIQLWDGPTGAINHAGIGIVNGMPEQLFRGMTNDMRWPSFTRRVMAVTGAALLVKRSVFNEVGMFDEKYHQYFQDVALCLRVREAGYSVIYTPYAKGINKERATFGEEHERPVMVSDLSLLQKQFDLEKLEKTDVLSAFVNRLRERAKGAMLA